MKQAINDKKFVDIIMICLSAIIIGLTYIYLIFV